MFKTIEGNFDNPEVNELLKKHFIELRAASPEESTHVLDIPGLKAPSIKFWSLWDDNKLLGCGALKILDKEHGEFKSIRIHDKYRNKGNGIKVIEHLIDEAKKLNDSFNSLVEKMNKEFEEVKIEQNALIKKTFEENKKIFDKKILEINNDFEDKKNKLNSDINENKEMITKELPKLCVDLSDKLYEKIMGERKKGSVSDFKKLVGDDK